MTSGIYKLTFKDGSIYIGKSSNIDKRWSQHSKAMLKGTHTKKIQEAFAKFGDPKFEVIFECHPDHIDIMEGYFINIFWNSKILNTTQPPLLTDYEIGILETVNEDVWGISTFQHLDAWKRADARVTLLEKTIENSKNAKLFKNTLEELTNTKYALELEKQEVKRLNSRGFFERLFNL